MLCSHICTQHHQGRLWKEVVVKVIKRSCERAKLGLTNILGKLPGRITAEARISRLVERANICQRRTPSPPYIRPRRVPCPGIASGFCLHKLFTLDESFAAKKNLPPPFPSPIQWLPIRKLYLAARAMVTTRCLGVRGKKTAAKLTKKCVLDQRKEWQFVVVLYSVAHSLYFPHKNRNARGNVIRYTWDESKKKKCAEREITWQKGGAKLW